LVCRVCFASDRLDIVLPCAEPIICVGRKGQSVTFWSGNSWRFMALVAVVGTALAGADLVCAGDLSGYASKEIVITPAGAELTSKEKQDEGWGAGTKRAVKKWAGALGKVTKHVFGVFGGDKPQEKKPLLLDSSSIKQPDAISGTRKEGDQTTAEELAAASTDAMQSEATSEGAVPKSEMQAVLAKPAAPERQAEPASASCKKAMAMISKYAFTDVEPRSCEGEVLKFAAFRDGEKFSVEVQARSGDLIKVEKLAPSAAPAQTEEHPRPY
jgi:hypothetical protein